MNWEQDGKCHVCSAIVEDEQDLIWIYRNIFARIGLPVSFAATDGLDALARFRESAPKPRVVLMDNRLPGMNGVCVTKEMIGDEPDTRVIFLSGDAGARGEAIDAGAFLFLEKPAGFREIVEAIECALDCLSVVDITADPGVHGETGSL